MSRQKDAPGIARSSAFGFFALFVAIMAIAIGKKLGVIDYDLAKRGVAVLLGVMLVGAGNLLPKFRLFDGPGRDPARVHSTERAAGWTFVLTGLMYIAVWLITPMDYALPLSSALGLAAFAVVASWWMRLAASAKDTNAVADPPTSSSMSRKILLATVLLTMLWAVAIFLVDYLWGDAASQWAAVWYPVLLGVVLALFTPLRQVLRQGDVGSRE